MNWLKRLHYTLLKRHAHAKPPYNGGYDGWRVVNDNVFIQWLDDVYEYGVRVAWHNFKVTVRELWRASADTGSE